MARILLLLAVMIPALVAPALAQRNAQPSKPQQRDLRIEKDPDEAPAPLTGEAKPSIPRSYAVVVGIANYQNLPEAMQLRYSERDAEAIYSILISPQGGNYRAENVRKLVGAKATLANLKRELEEWLPSVAKSDDRVLIYFAGHGFIAGGEAYLAPYDIHPDRVAMTAYPMSRFGKVVGSDIQARWKVVLTDSCHSGAITPETENSKVNAALQGLDVSIFSLTASRDREQSFESPDWGGGHGIFTYYVVRGLEGAADESGDGIVTADELAEYVRRNVREATEGRQNPTMDRGSWDPQMLLAYNPTSARPADPNPPKDGALIFESNMDGVELFLNGVSQGVVNKGQPLRLPGLKPGAHIVKAVKMGFEPDGPREEIVYPGQEKTVTIRILIPRRRKQAAIDHLDRGLEFYTRGYENNYRKAAEAFEKALAIEPTYSQAALYLGRAYNALYEQQKAEVFYRKAIEIDPDYLEARSSFAGMLLDIGNTDEAIRQLNVVSQRNKSDPMAWYLLAQAYRMKDLYKESIEAARKGIRLMPDNAEVHFWLAESLRMNGDYEESIAEYDKYLRLSDFDSKLAGKLNYYVLGFLVGRGKKSRAAQADIWKDLRSLAYFGLCDSNRRLSRFDAAIIHCERSLTYDREDPYTHYALGLSFARKAEAAGSLELLAAANQHFRTMLDLNEHLAEAEYARKNIASIDALLQGR